MRTSARRVRVRAFTPFVAVGALGVVFAGCSGRSRPSVPLDAALAPQALVDPASLAGPAPHTVAFADASGGRATSWLWSFADGATATDRDPTHTYLQPGTYAVQLRITDGRGRQGAAVVATITVTQAPASAGPGAAGSGAAGSGAAGSGAVGSGTPGAATPGATATPTAGQGSRFWYVNDQHGNPLEPHSASEAIFAAEVVTELNAERARAGLPPLATDADGTRAGKAHAEDMGDRTFFAHLSPEGWGPDERLSLTGATGPFRLVGENIARGQTTARGVVDAWMASPPHRANVLGQFTHVGVGVQLRDGMYCAVFLAR